MKRTFYNPNTFLYRVVLTRSTEICYSDPTVYVVATAVEAASKEALLILGLDWKDEARWYRVAKVEQIQAVNGIAEETT